MNVATPDLTIVAGHAGPSRCEAQDSDMIIRALQAHQGDVRDEFMRPNTNCPRYQTRSAFARMSSSVTVEASSFIRRSMSLPWLDVIHERTKSLRVFKSAELKCSRPLSDSYSCVHGLLPHATPWCVRPNSGF